MPVQAHPAAGYVLHDIDVATNKVLALAGRNEPRDFVDVLYLVDHVLPLGPLVWASAAKDPGYTPLSLLEQIRRRGRYRSEDFERLDLVRPLDLESAKREWLSALAEAEAFIESRPMEEAGCLYWHAASQHFVAPSTGVPLENQGIVLHFGRAGGVLPRPSAD